MKPACLSWTWVFITHQKCHRGLSVDLSSWKSLYCSHELKNGWWTRNIRPIQINLFPYICRCVAVPFHSLWKWWRSISHPILVRIRRTNILTVYGRFFMFCHFHYLLLLFFRIVLILIGRPMYFMELSLGQFASTSSVKVWELSPILKGVGYGQAIATFCVCSYYTILISLAINYFAGPRT